MQLRPLHKQFDFHSVAIHLKFIPQPNHHSVDETPRYVRTSTKENLKTRAMEDLQVNGKLTAMVIDDENANAATARLESLGQA